MQSQEELKDNATEENPTSAPEPLGSGAAEESAAEKASEAGPAGAEQQDKPEEQRIESPAPADAVADAESPQEEESSKPVKEKSKKIPKKAPAKKAEKQAKAKKAKKKAEEGGNPEEAVPEEELSPEEFKKEQDKRKTQLLKRFEVCKQDISVMRQKLNEINKLREGVFSEKDGMTSEIGSMIKRIRELKHERDDFTGQVRAKKAERSRLNKLVREKIQEIKNKRMEQDEMMKSRGIQDLKRSPEALLKQIEKMEFSIETEAMPFAQEKKLMDQIKQRRKEYEELSVVSKVMMDVHSLSKEINTLKRESDTVHRDIQDLATKSQERHEELLKISGDIDKIKDSEKGIFDQFADYKKQYNEQNAKLRAKLNEMTEVKQELAQIESSLRQQKQEELKQEMQVKQDEVEDKIKRGKKLTTADLLIFQKTDIIEKKSGKK